MRWIRFSQQGRKAYGILEGDRIAEVSGDPFAGWERTARKHDLAAVKIEVPVVPPTFYCVGLNYAEHIREGGGVAVEREQTFPYVFMKPPTTTLTHPGKPILLPAAAPDHVD